MMIEGNWFAPGFLKNDYLVENVASVVLPKEKVNATITNGLGWAASANTKYPEEVKKLMAFLASEDANKIQAETGASIPALKGFEDEWAASSDTIDLSAFGKMLSMESLVHTIKMDYELNKQKFKLLTVFCLVK